MLTHSCKVRLSWLPTKRERSSKRELVRLTCFSYLQIHFKASLQGKKEQCWEGGKWRRGFTTPNNWICGKTAYIMNQQPDGKSSTCLLLNILDWSVFRVYTEKILFYEKSKSFLNPFCVITMEISFEQFVLHVLQVKHSCF